MIINQLKMLISPLYRFFTLLLLPDRNSIFSKINTSARRKLFLGHGHGWSRPVVLAFMLRTHAYSCARARVYIRMYASFASAASSGASLRTPCVYRAHSTKANFAVTNREAWRMTSGIWAVGESARTKQSLQSSCWMPYSLQANEPFRALGKKYSDFSMPKSQLSIFFKQKYKFL